MTWSIHVERSEELPPMAWVCSVSTPRATLACGRLVRDVDGGVFEGSWVGKPGARGILESTTTFGSGVLGVGDRLHVIPPSHMIEALYSCRSDASALFSNSFVALLSAARLELDPHADYPALFAQMSDGMFRFELPTKDGTPIEVILFDGLSIGLDGGLRPEDKPRERPFESFLDYRRRLSEALRSAIDNAPGFEPIATISSGYDSATVATLASELGARRAVTVVEGKPVRGSTSLADSGEYVAERLGMEIAKYRRLEYMERDDLVEADFLASGMTGEDVVLSSAEPLLDQRMLLTGYFGDGVWWLNRPARPLMWRLDQTGQGHSEFRLRVGYIHVPLPWFGAPVMGSVAAISRSPEMQPWVLGIDNDRPIPRRILEEGGIERGRFADAKRAPSAAIHTEGPSALAPATRASLERFARNNGQPVEFRRRSFARWRRAGIRLARRLRSTRLRAWFEAPRRAHQRHQRDFGNLLLAWSVSVVAPRYAALGDLLRRKA